MEIEGEGREKKRREKKKAILTEEGRHGGQNVVGS